MVGLKDIPCVGIVVDKISEAAVDAGTRGLRYVFCYNQVVNDLNSEIEKIKIQENAVGRKSDEARGDGKIIEKHVLDWQKDVQNIKPEAEGLSTQKASCSCFNVVRLPNPVSRFRYGRKAAHVTQNIAELVATGESILTNEISHHPPNEDVPISDTTYHNFGSREEAYGKLWDALCDKDGYPILGIYGMPGVGKTRMMEEAWIRAKEKGIFNKVTRANVGGEKIDVINLQEQLAGYLDCHLASKDNELHRASQLKHSLTNGGKILVVLDDVWEHIPWHNIGIPFLDHASSNGCKILLTSRKYDICLVNGCKDPIEIKPLASGEAWEMFKKTVGDPKIESLVDDSLANKISQKCSGLPLFVDAIGKALKNMPEITWKDALDQLENGKFQEIDGLEDVYASLEMSFKKLTEAARTCLLLCSLFPKEADIEIKMLLDLVSGSHLLHHGRNIDGVIDILKSSSLLLQGKQGYSVKMHNIIRDVARSIATSDSKYAFSFIRCISRFPDNVDYSTRRLLHLELEGGNVRFPNDLTCPEMHTLWLQCDNHSQQLSDGFFKAFKNLKVLLLKGMSSSHQHLSIHALEKLRMLILDGCDIDQAFLNSVSKNLETLCIWECDLPSPLDLTELTNLRKLELFSATEVEMVPGTASILSRIEVNIPGGFKICGAELVH